MATALLAFAVAAVHCGQAFVVTPLMMGASSAGAVATDARREVGGTRTPISAIASPVTTKEIQTVGNVEEFDRIVARPKQVVAVWFQASWCRKCKYIGSRLRRLDEHLPAYLTNNLVLVSIDVNKVAEVPQRQKIKDLPTIQFFVEGKEVGSYVATDRGEAFYSNMERHLRAAQEDDGDAATEE